MKSMNEPGRSEQQLGKPEQAPSILDQIVAQRRKDIAQHGWTLGESVPKKRQRGKPVPFVAEKSSVLEIKRASPSKGDIAPALDAAKTAVAYAKAGTRAISVLTEQHWFKGSLSDLQEAAKACDEYCAATGKPRIAILRKDFLLSQEEITIAYRCGADAVLLIARILEKAMLSSMIQTCADYDMTAFIELRTEADVEKLTSALAVLDEKAKHHIVCGVNARDLADFSIDLLTPSMLIRKLQGALGQVRCVFESGIRTPEAAAFAGSLGFTGMLLGEAAAKNPAKAGALVDAFCSARENAHSRFWSDYAANLASQHTNSANRKTPLVKICGLTNEADAIDAAAVGAAFLGFMFYAPSKRCVQGKTVRKIKSALSAHGHTRQKLVGVIADTESAEAKEAIALTQEGILDVLQLHGFACATAFLSEPAYRALPHYAVANLACESDLDEIASLAALGEARILLDAKTKQADAHSGTNLGGTGASISHTLIEKAGKKHKLWIAGGIRPENVSALCDAHNVELIDVSSGVESEPGKKDRKRIAALFEAIRRER